MDTGDRFDYVHPDDDVKQYVVIDPKVDLKPGRAANLGVAQGGMTFMRRVDGGLGRGEIAAVMTDHLPGRFGRGEFVKA